MERYNIAILGTGKFALSILYILSKKISKITSYGRDTVQLKELEQYSTNSKYCKKKYCF